MHELRNSSLCVPDIPDRYNSASLNLDCWVYALSGFFVKKCAAKSVENSFPLVYCDFCVHVQLRQHFISMYIICLGSRMCQCCYSRRVLWYSREISHLWVQDISWRVGVQKNVENYLKGICSTVIPVENDVYSVFGKHVIRDVEKGKGQDKPRTRRL